MSDEGAAPGQDGGSLPGLPAPDRRGLRRRRVGPRTPWQVAGLVVGIVAAVVGLLLLAFVVWFMVALSQWGDNK